MATNQKGFIGRKVLLLMSLIFSFFSFCLLQKLTLITNTIPNSKNEIATHQTHNSGFGEKKHEAYEFPKDKSVSLSTNSNLDPRVVSRFSVPEQELEKPSINPKATFGKLSYETSRALDASNTIKRRDLKEMVAIFERHGWVWLEQKDSPQFQK